MARKLPDQGFIYTKDMVLDSAEVPGVLRKYRSEAWNSYRELPFPTLKDEAWRRTSLRDFDFKSVQLSRPTGLSGTAHPLSTGILPEKFFDKKPTALLGPAGVEIRGGDKLAQSGVIFSSLQSAAENHPDLVEKVLGKIVSPSDGKFAAAAGAFAAAGIFIYVPRGVIVEDPLFGIITSGPENSALFFQTVIYLEENSSLSYLQETLSPLENSTPSLTGENLEIFVGQNATLRITELQTFGEKVWSFGHKKALVERDGTLEWDIGALGSALSKHFVSVDLVGEGAEARVSGMFFAEDDQHMTYNTQQRHLAPRTSSDLLFKGALTGSSRSVWRGMIYVAPGARFIDGYQANRNLLLDPAARSDSIPGLEILNNDVRCTHGSTVGKIDQEQLFYLLSRGIPRKEAEQLVIQGFFEDILSRFPLQEVGNQLWSKIQNKLLA